MTEPARPDPLRHILEQLPQRIPVEQIDRLWIFPVRTLGVRESGLVVLSTLPGGEDDGPRRVLTLRYEIDTRKKDATPSAELAEQGSAPADLIQRVIEGVIRRLGDEAGEPVLREIAGDAERWAAMLDSASPAAVDRASGE